MKVNYNYQKDESAFTMVELLVAIAILSIIIIGMAGYFAFNVSLANDSGVEDQALRLARSSIERLKAGAREAADDSGTTLESKLNHLKGDLVNLPNEYQDILDNITVKIEDYNTYIKQVTVRVEWDSNSQNVELTTLIAER